MKNKNLFLIPLIAIFAIGCVKSNVDHLLAGGEQTGATAKSSRPDLVKEKNPVRSYDHDGTKNDKTPDPKIDCKDIACTAQFVSIELGVTDGSGNPVVLDSYHTEDMAGNKLPSYMFGYNDIHKTYEVINDAWVMNHQNTTLQVHFFGYKNGTKVVDEVYTIKTDCCHISKTHGKDLVIL